MTTAAWNREHCDAGEDEPATEHERVMAEYETWQAARLASAAPPFDESSADAPAYEAWLDTLTDPDNAPFD